MLAVVFVAPWIVAMFTWLLVGAGAAMVIYVLVRGVYCGILDFVCWFWDGVDAIVWPWFEEWFEAVPVFTPAIRGVLWLYDGVNMFLPLDEAMGLFFAYYAAFFIAVKIKLFTWFIRGA